MRIAGYYASTVACSNKVDDAVLARMVRYEKEYVPPARGGGGSATDDTSSSDGAAGCCIIA